jgi:hypothetical protein
MRKFNVLLAFCLIFTVSLSAQSEKEKVNYLPEEGDFGIGLDGTPIFNYVGNMFNGTNNNRLNVGDTKLYFRYMITDNTAARLCFSLAQYNLKDREYVRDDAALAIDGNSTKQLEDLRITKNNFFEVKVGYQYFKDFRRLRGFFGGDLGYSRNRDRAEYFWGNIMTDVNPRPTSAFVGPNADSRYLFYDYGAYNTFFVGAFTGAEYYIMPKICLGLEFGISYGAGYYGQEYYTYETMAGNNRVEYDKAVSPKDRYFTTKTYYPYTYGNFYFMIHF